MKKRFIPGVFLVLLLYPDKGFSQSEPGNPNPAKTIRIYPNPVQDGRFFIEQNSSDENHTQRLLIFNSNGVLLENRPLARYKGSPKEAVDIAGYAPGNYFIRIVDLEDPGFSFSMQLLVN